jgi:hypothetical protein
VPTIQLTLSEETFLELRREIFYRRIELQLKLPESVLAQILRNIEAGEENVSISVADFVHVTR